MRGSTRLLFVVAICIFSAPMFAQERFFDSDGVNIRYVERGVGEPVVLVHGIMGTVENNWDETGVLSDLSRDHHVIAFDMRGHGKSDKPHDPSLYGREMALDIVRLLDHLKIQKAHLVGYSLGSFVVGLAVVVQPGRFASVTFGGESPFIGDWTTRTIQNSEQSAKQIEDGLLRSLITANAPPGAPPTEEEIRQRSVQALMGQDRQAIAAVRRSYGAFLVTESQLRSVSVPLLGVAGSDDPSLADIEYLRKLRPDTEVVVINGATHNAPRNARARLEFVEAIRRFIDTHPTAQSQK